MRNHAHQRGNFKNHTSLRQSLNLFNTLSAPFNVSIALTRFTRLTVEFLPHIALVFRLNAQIHDQDDKYD